MSKIQLFLILRLRGFYFKSNNKSDRHKSTLAIPAKICVLHGINSIET